MTSESSPPSPSFPFDFIENSLTADFDAKEASMDALSCSFKE
jgi:hypothetical protein